MADGATQLELTAIVVALLASLTALVRTFVAQRQDRTAWLREERYVRVTEYLASQRWVVDLQATPEGTAIPEIGPGGERHSGPYADWTTRDERFQTSFSLLFSPRLALDLVGLSMWVHFMHLLLLRAQEAQKAPSSSAAVLGDALAALAESQRNYADELEATLPRLRREIDVIGSVHALRLSLSAATVGRLRKSKARKAQLPDFSAFTEPLARPTPARRRRSPILVRRSGRTD